MTIFQRGVCQLCLRTRSHPHRRHIPPLAVHREKGMKIFVWPKVIFLYPTAIVALICWAGMW